MKDETKNAPANKCSIPDAKYLTPGVGFSQNYEPEKGTYGGNFYLILGPWNVLDIGPSPQYNIIAEPGVDIEISTDPITGALQFRKVSVNVNGYFKPTSLATRRDENIADAYANLEFNLQERTLIGAFGMRMKVDVPLLTSPLIQIPADYGLAVFETKANYAKGLLAFSFDPKNPSFNFKFGGSSIQDKFKSASGLPYNEALLNLNNLLQVKSSMYFQFGSQVDEFPPIKELIPQISDMESSQYNVVKVEDNAILGGKSDPGISFGYKGNITGKTEVGPLVGKFEVELGLNVMMTKKGGVICNNTSNEPTPIGIKGWYAQGQAYGYANCNVNLQYNLLFVSGLVNIMKAGAFVLLEAKAPNPSYFSGRVNANYSALDGLLEGSFNIKVELGKKCANLELP